MPRCRKASLEKRRRDQRNAQIKYREQHGDFQRERNRQLTALRRTNEDYRIEERSKCRKAMRKKRFCEQMKKKAELKAQVYLVKSEFDNNIPVNCITNRVNIPTYNESDREREHELSYSIINGYGYNERNSFPKLENYYLQEGLQRETCAVIEPNPKKPHPTGICASNAEFCMPIPVKKFIKFNPNAVKRGRGRPRKDSLASNISNPHNSSFLEEDLQCSTDDDEDGFQEVSEDENNPASFLEGERVHSMSTAGGSEGGSDLIDAAHIKTEMKIEPTHLGGDDSMDLDPNYDPSDFLTMHNRMGNNETNQQQQDNKMSQFLQHEEIQNENIQTTHDNKTNMHQMPLMMGSNDNMGIDDDLAISESDEEDDGNVRVKRELFTDQLEDDQEQQQMLQQQSIIDMQMQQQQQQQEQLPIQSYVDIDASKEDYQQQQEQHHQPQTQPTHHDDNNDDDWLRF